MRPFQVQLNLQSMLDAKKAAHAPYEVIRTEIPQLCKGTNVDAAVLEDYIIGRLNTSALDAAVAALSQKAEGLFLYAYLLKQHLESEAEAKRELNFQNLDSLPAGLGKVYAVNFRRAFPQGAKDPVWAKAQPLVELIAAAREPITVGTATSLLALHAIWVQNNTFVASTPTTVKEAMKGGADAASEKGAD